MQKKVSNYLAEKLIEEGITNVFMITGGGAMHLNDAIGHQEGLSCGGLCDDRPGRDQCDDRGGGGLYGFDSHAGDFRAGAV